MQRVSTKMIAMAVIAVAAFGAIRAIQPENWKSKRGVRSGIVEDEALCAGRSVETLTAADDDYFSDMDHGATKNPGAIAKALAPLVPGITPEEAAKTAANGHNLKALPENASDEDAPKVFSNALEDLLAVNKCPDFIVNRGHSFCTGLLQGGARSERRGQAGSDRIPEDTVRAPIHSAGREAVGDQTK